MNKHRLTLLLYSVHIIRIIISYRIPSWHNLIIKNVVEVKKKNI